MRLHWWSLAGGCKLMLTKGEIKAMATQIWTFTKSNFGTILAIQIILGLLLFCCGCESSVNSIQDPSKKVTRSQLQLEVETFLSQAERRDNQLDQQDALKNEVFKHALLFAETGGVNPIGAITALTSILGIGAIADNVTKRRKERKALKSYVADVKNKNPIQS